MQFFIVMMVFTFTLAGFAMEWYVIDSSPRVVGIDGSIAVDDLPVNRFVVRCDWYMSTC